jgi:hypothetical protein
MGERAKNIGNEAEEKICILLGSLGYEFQDINVEDYDIDSIVESPPDSPKVGLARPRYSPNGLAAIEVKEPNVTKEKVDTFRKKILKYNRENSKKLGGGIYIADCKISQKMMEYMKRRHIWGWGQKRLRLYSEKATIFKTWFEKSFTAEIPIGAHTSFIRVSTLTTRQTLRFSVFFDDETRKLSPSLLNEIMRKIKKKSISPLIDLGIRPLNVYFEFYSIGGLGIRLREETYKTVAMPWKDQGIIVLIDKESFRDFRTFPTV